MGPDQLIRAKALALAVDYVRSYKTSPNQTVFTVADAMFAYIRTGNRPPLYVEEPR